MTFPGSPLIPVVLREPLLGQALFGPVDHLALQADFDNKDANIDGMYASLKAQENLFKQKKGSFYLNPVDRAFAWRELFEHLLECGLKEAADELFLEAEEKGIFNVPEYLFDETGKKIPVDTKKIQDFKEAVEAFFKEDDERFFAPHLENEERERPVFDLDEKLLREEAIEEEVLLKMAGKGNWQRV
ncbi:MAG: hypothetical protein WC371_03980 [Parachlamydiales bacterium]|jgi:hypothetical protein